ncbi:MAG: 3-hydroxybutyryl-CoA dehydrogenase [Flavobacteriaceae bacterium]|nr:3-hydroxybutyryl-CoA dehydrogenase [Bacteroidia bacterium]NNK87249.1 3-hydroxybutyryl-CoA dehydrogenase [Flavobacteriaceae bacterium]
MKTVGIIGSGTMGSGIAQVAASSGCQVIVYDSDPEALTRSESNLDKILTRLIEKGRIDSEEKQKIKDNISYADSLDAIQSSAIIIEAIVEDLDIKKQVFQRIESLVASSTILATNTSSLSVASIASVLKEPERCIGIHFFNPVPLMKLVEIVPAIQTDKKTTDQAVELIRSWKKAVAIAKDTPGFIVNRVARPFYSESLRIYEEGVAHFSVIDHSLKSRGGFRMGPFELMDFIGHDVNYAVTESVFKAFYFDPRYKPSFTQKRLVEAGYLGRKSGNGFYTYDKDGKPILVEKSGEVDAELSKRIFERVLIMLINEAADAVFLNIASIKDVDMAMKTGVNYPKGLLAWADELGIDWCVHEMDKLYDEYHEDRYRCSPLLRHMLRENKKFYN